MIETYKEEALFIAKRVEDEAHSSSSIKAARTIRMLLTMLEAANLNAARYQWLKENAAEFLPCVIDATGRLLDENGADRAIDAAMAATKGEQ